jgi:hypothetical protein
LDGECGKSITTTGNPGTTMANEQKPQGAARGNASKEKEQSSDTTPNRRTMRAKSFWLGHEPTEELAEQPRRRPSSPREDFLDAPIHAATTTTTSLLHFEGARVDTHPIERASAGPARIATSTTGPVRWVQPKLRITAPGDRFEQEADRIAEEVVKRIEGPHAESSKTGTPSANSASAPQPALSPLAIQTSSISSAAAGTAAPPSVDRALSASGQALPNETRERMEEQFGEDFGDVRVHVGSAAVGSADDIGARAYTAGRSIVFGSGEFKPGTHEGNRLIAHELTHVVQQHGATQRVQRQHKPEKQMPAKKPGVSMPFSLKLPDKWKKLLADAKKSNRPAHDEHIEIQNINGIISIKITGDYLMTAFLEQYRGLRDDQAGHTALDQERKKWSWSRGVPNISEHNIVEGYINLTVTDNSIKPSTPEEKKANQKYFHGLTPGQQKRFDASAKRKAKSRTGPGGGISPDDKGLAAYQTELRDELVRKQKAIDDLPPGVRAVLFSDIAATALDPEDFDTIISIGKKLSTLTPQELKEYESRVTETTNDWKSLDQAVDQFLAEQKQRRVDADTRTDFTTRLYDMDAFYARYRQLLELRKNADRFTAISTSPTNTNSDPQSAGAALGTEMAVDDIEAGLDADLQAVHFPRGLAGFRDAIDGYIVAFETETRTIAMVMLDQYEHQLMREERRYQKPEEAAALYNAVAQSSARADYARAETIRKEHASSVVLSAEEMTDQARWASERNVTLNRADQSVRTAASGHELVGNKDFNREKLANAAPGDVQSMMLDYIRDRKNDIATTRDKLRKDPSVIYGLDKLISASFEAQNIEKGTIYDKILRDHISDVNWKEVIESVVLAVIAIAAGIFSGGTGAVAVFAAGTAFGIGAYQAVEEYKRYELKSAAYGAKLASDDPSLAWVIVAVIGAGIDAAVFASVLPKLRPALAAFESGAEAGNVVTLEQKLRALDIKQTEIVDHIIAGAKARAEALEAWRAIGRPTATLNMVLIPGAAQFGQFVRMLYFAGQSAWHEFQAFTKTGQFIETFGEISTLNPAKIEEIKTAFTAGRKEIDAIVEHGQSLGMSEANIKSFINHRGNTEGMTAEQLMAEMSVWKTRKDSGLPFGFKDAEQFQEFKATASRELQKLLKRSDPDAQAFLQGSAIEGTSFKRYLPFDKDSDFDIAISSRYLFKQAEKLGLEVRLSPRRILLNNQKLIDKVELDRFVRKLSEVISDEGTLEARTINILLFDNVESVRKPLGDAIREIERPTLPLTAR